MIPEYMLAYTDPVWLVADLVEFSLALLFFRSCAPRDDRPAVGVALAVVAFALLHGIHLLHLDFVWDFTLNIALIALYLSASRRVYLQQALYFASVFVMFTEIGKVLCVDFVLQPMVGTLSAAPSLVVTLAWIVVTYAFTALFAFATRRWVFVDSIGQLSWLHLVALLTPLVPYACIRAGGYMLDDSDPDLYRNTIVTAALLGVGTIVTIILNAYNLGLQMHKAKAAQMEAALRQQHERYLSQRDAADAVRRQCHDMKHVISQLEALASQPCSDEVRGDLAEYVARLKEEARPLESRFETGNGLLDVLLSEKYARCCEADIRPVFYVDAAGLGFVNGIDLCALFGNVLDNAVEACEKVEGPEGREILLDVRTVGQMTLIRCSNPFDGELRRGVDGLLTTKGDAERHGFGLRSIAAVAERYGGSMSLSHEDGQFRLTVLLPWPSSVAV